VYKNILNIMDRPAVFSARIKLFVVFCVRNSMHCDNLVALLLDSGCGLLKSNNSEYCFLETWFYLHG